MLKELGESLREAREARGLTLEDVERSTRIRVKYLAALENGELDSLPTPVQVRGFLRNYAKHVGLDPAETTLRLEEALNAARRRPLLAFFRRKRKTSDGSSHTPPKNGDPSPKTTIASVSYTPTSIVKPGQPRVSRLRRLRRFLTLDVIIVGVIFVVIMAFFVWGGTRVAAAVLTQPAITVTPQVLGPTATPSLISNITFTPTPPPPLVNFTDVQLTLLAEQRTFVRVIVDGELDFEGLLTPGEQRDYAGAQSIEVTTGNAAGVRAIHNQRELGPLGAFGEVITLIFQPNEAITPTPSTTPTPSETPIPTGEPLPIDTPISDAGG